MKHSVAPWSVVRQPDAMHIAGMDRVVVASRIRSRADADLIAAAPELYRACEAALAKAPDIPDWFRVRELLQSAIRQAEGRTAVCAMR